MCSVQTTARHSLPPPPLSLASLTISLAFLSLFGVLVLHLSRLYRLKPCVGTFFLYIATVQFFCCSQQSQSLLLFFVVVVVWFFFFWFLLGRKLCSTHIMSTAMNNLWLTRWLEWEVCWFAICFFFLLWPKRRVAHLTETKTKKDHTNERCVPECGLQCDLNVCWFWLIYVRREHFNEVMFWMHLVTMPIARFTHAHTNSYTWHTENRTWNSWQYQQELRQQQQQQL